MPATLTRPTRLRPLRERLRSPRERLDASARLAVRRYPHERIAEKRTEGDIKNLNAVKCLMGRRTVNILARRVFQDPDLRRKAAQALRLKIRDKVFQEEGRLNPVSDTICSILANEVGRANWQRLYTEMSKLRNEVIPLDMPSDVLVSYLDSHEGHAVYWGLSLTNWATEKLRDQARW